MATYYAQVTRVIDGDTIEVQHGTESIRIRLDNIDTRERGEQGASAATIHLYNLINGEQVTIEEKGVDQFDRTRAHVWRTRDSLPINKTMVDGGYTRWIPYPQV